MQKAERAHSRSIRPQIRAPPAGCTGDVRRRPEHIATARMAAKLATAAQAPRAIVVALLLVTFLVLEAAVVANARPLKLSSSSSEGGGARAAAVESPAGDIKTVVGGHRLMDIGMLVGIKDSGPSPGAGH
ncbi:hypothetical protein ACP70R_043399 [Stipagrostis hirtigluma subsp. patula]